VTADKARGARRSAFGFALVLLGGLVALVLRTRSGPAQDHPVKAGLVRGGTFAKPSSVRRRRRRRRHVRMAIGAVLAVAVAVSVAVVLVRRDHDDRPSVAAVAPTIVSSSTTTTTTIPIEDVSYVATARFTGISVFDSPEAKTVVAQLPNPWFINDDPAAAVPLVFHVETFRPDGWAEVMLPLRPNGSTGWVRNSDVTFTPIHYRLTIELAAHRLRVYLDNKPILEDTVAVGAAATPTPQGRFYIRALLRAPNPDTVYGPFAFGLSGHSEVLEEFNGGDGEVGIHGNNDASVLGTDVSHGCVRMSNDKITELTTYLPLGTPVEITA